jgi:hypothetical protein
MKLAALTLCLLSAAPKAPPVNDEPAKYETPADLKDRLQLLSDGKGHYIALDPKGGYHGPFFYGDGKSMYLLRSPGGGASGNEFSVSMWDPRVDWAANGYATFTYRDEKYSVLCPPKTTQLAVVPAAEAKKLVEGTTLFQPRWQRRPHRLARDDNGIYYFVDCARDDSSGSCSRDWRLYTGLRGQLKLQQMTNIVSDSVGQIFSTKGGELRLVLNEEGDKTNDGVKDKTLKWVNGKSVTQLVNVPIDDNARMIYTGLGVYDREKLGTPCDDL